MTSPFTDEATQKFFENHKYFGLEANQVQKLHFINFLKVLISYFLYLLANLKDTLWMQVTFFQQGTIPCVSNDGRFIMETPFKVWSLFVNELN